MAWAVGEVTGAGLTAVVEREVDALLAAVGGRRVDEMVDQEAAKTTARRAAEIVRASEVVAELAVEIPVSVHSLPHASEHLLAEVVHRDDIEALVGVLLSLDRLHARGLGRIAGSPMVGVVASAFVTRLVTDVLQQNREWAQKVPGVSSLFSLGGSAVGMLRGFADKPAEALLGEMTGKGGEFAIHRTNAALLGLVGEAPLHDAAMESWDLQAGEPVSDLADYLLEEDVRSLAEVVARLIGRAGGTAYAEVVLDACVDLLFDRYGAHEVAAFLAEAGVSRDDLVDVAERHLRPLVEALRESGELDRIVRDRLAPFYASREVLTLLGAPGAKTPAKKTTAKKTTASKSRAIRKPGGNG